MKKYFEKTRNPHEIARLAGTKVSVARQKMRAEVLPALYGWGRVSLQPYLLSRRRAYAEAWPDMDAHVILEAKRLHDQGRVNMCQGRDGEYILQYAIPNPRPVRRQPYFYGG